MNEAIEVLKARLARHRAAGRLAQAQECQRCIHAIQALRRKANDQ